MSGVAVRSDAPLLVRRPDGVRLVGHAPLIPASGQTERFRVLPGPIVNRS